MSSRSHARPLLPVVVSTGLLLLVVVAALLPNLGIGGATANCSYGSCPSSTAPNYNTYYAALAVLAIVAVALGILLFMRRRRGGSSPGPLTEAEPATPSSGAPSAPGGPEPAEQMAPDAASGTVPAAAVAAPAVPAAAGAAYIEGPEDVGAAPPAALGAAAPAAAAEGGSEDIDSLMQELDKISGEILKRPATKKDGTSSGEPTDDEGTSSS